MLNKKICEALDTLKEKEPGIYNEINTFLGDSLKELSFASHEIKNQISFLYSSYQLMEYRNPGITENEFWVDMGASFKTLIDFVERTSLYRNSIKSEPSLFNLNDILFEIPDIIDEKYEYSNEFIFDTGSGIPVKYDRDKIKTALTEITANACEVSESPVTLKLYISDNNTVVEIINDTIKINNDIDKIFTPFYTTKETPHTGLGLSIAQMICLKQNVSLNFIQDISQTTVQLIFKNTI